MSKVYNIEFKVISARFGGSKEKLAEDPLYKFRIYFSRKNTQKGIIENLSTSKIQLKDSLMYFNNESIKFTDIDIANDRLEISFVLIKDTIKRYKPLIISINTLSVDIEKEEIWTLSTQSLVNLTYHIQSETQRQQILETDHFNQNQIQTIIECKEVSPNNTNVKKNASDSNLINTIAKSQISPQDHLTRTPCEVPKRINSLLSSIGRNNYSPGTEKTKSLFEPNSTSKYKKFDIPTSLFQKASQNDVNPINANDNTNGNYINTSKDIEIIEGKDINSSDNINEKSTIGSNTTNNSSNPIENYDTFIQAIFVSGLFTETPAEKIKKSEEFIAPCGHKECSFLPSFKPNILYSYVNKTAQTKPEINALVANMGFPLGIKFCYYCLIDQNKKMSRTPRPQQSFVNVMKNEKNELYYVSTLQYFLKIGIKDFENIYKINPLKEYVSSNNNSPKISKNNKNEKKQSSIQVLSELMINDLILIPESVSLVSRYPYFTSMDICLKAIISLHKDDMHQLIAHIINEVPIPPKDNLVLFYVPKSTNAVKVYSPLSSNNDSVSLLNYNLLLDYFSIDNICIIFQLILLEQKLLFVHNNYQELSKISFLFLNLIYPFSWINPYIPVLNLSTVQFLQSFIPYIMGTDEYLLKYADQNYFLNQNEVIIIDIAKDTLTLNKNRKKAIKKSLFKELNLPELPEKVKTFLISELKTIKKCIITDMEIINKRIKEVFIKVMIMLIGDYKSFTFMVNDDMPLFNKEGFLFNHQHKDMKAFLSELVMTQIFNQFLFNEKQLMMTIMNQNQQQQDSDNVIHGDSVSSLAMNLFDTSYFKKMIPKYQSLINVQQVKKRSNSVSNKADTEKERNKSIPNHINSSFHNPIKESGSICTSILKSNFTHAKSEISTQPETKIKTYLLLPYFILNPIMSLDKKKIEDYIGLLLKKKSLKDINSVENHCFIISNKKGYQFNNLVSKKRYFLTSSSVLNAVNKDKDNNSSKNINSKLSLISKSATLSPDAKQEKEEVPSSSLFSVELFNCANMNTIKKCESLTNIARINTNETILSYNHQSLLNECFKNICTSKKKITQNQFEQLNQILQTTLGREYFIKLLFPEESIANEENHKQLTMNSYDDLLYLINLCLKYLRNNEYYSGRLLTLACFSYYKIDKNNSVRYIYKDLINGAYPTNIWTQEEFWSNFCNEEIQVIQHNTHSNSINDNDNELEIDGKINTDLNIEERLLSVADIMMRLKLNNNCVKKVVIEQNALNRLNKNIVGKIEDKLFNN